jgi:hypothetical protein
LEHVANGVVEALIRLDVYEDLLLKALLEIP